jgi:hypothetical protein
MSTIPMLQEAHPSLLAPNRRICPRPGTYSGAISLSNTSVIRTYSVTAQATIEEGGRERGKVVPSRSDDWSGQDRTRFRVWMARMSLKYVLSSNHPCNQLTVRSVPLSYRNDPGVSDLLIWNDSLNDNVYFEAKRGTRWRGTRWRGPTISRSSRMATSSSRSAMT